MSSQVDGGRITMRGAHKRWNRLLDNATHCSPLSVQTDVESQCNHLVIYIINMRIIWNTIRDRSYPGFLKSLSMGLVYFAVFF
jgi:hypothetical protein